MELQFVVKRPLEIQRFHLKPCCLKAVMILFTDSITFFEGDM